MTQVERASEYEVPTTNTWIYHVCDCVRLFIRGNIEPKWELSWSPKKPIGLSALRRWMKSIVSNQPPMTFQADREHDNSHFGWILPRIIASELRQMVGKTQWTKVDPRHGRSTYLLWEPRTRQSQPLSIPPLTHTRTHTGPAGFKTWSPKHRRGGEGWNHQGEHTAEEFVVAFCPFFVWSCQQMCGKHWNTVTFRPRVSALVIPCLTTIQ